MRTYSKMKAEVRRILDAAGYEDVQIYPGPDVPDDYPGACVVLTRYGGPGLDVDGAMDDVSWQERSISKAFDPEYGEGIADAIDLAFLSHHSRDVDGVWVSEIRRVGGAPTALMTDDNDRTHYVCSHIVSTELALAN